ncbi:MAG: hypothetical protein ABIJ09_27585 [Pseudomonadota bacterium]
MTRRLCAARWLFLGVLLATLGCGVKSRPQPPASRLLQEISSPAATQISTH